MAQNTDHDDWLIRFHAGEQQVLERCYRDYFDTVSQTVGRYLFDADKETIVHDVFLSLIAEPRVRQSFQGGSIAGWLVTLARNRSIDFLRRRRREVVGINTDQPADVEQSEVHSPDKAEAQQLVATFCNEHLPEKWAPVFRARFIEELSQREAAQKLGISRTTLAYRERCAWHLFRRFVLDRPSEKTRLPRSDA